MIETMTTAFPQTSGLHIRETAVCIVGAGPAGTAASLTLSKAGVSHILLDGAAFPRHKPCGDIITSGVLRAMNDLTPEILIRLKKGGFLNPVWRTLTYPPNGKPVAIDFLPMDGKANEPSCYSVSRFDMDRIVLDIVQESSFVEWMDDCRITRISPEEDFVKLTTANGTIIQAKLAIIATGSSNNVLKQLGLEIPKSDAAIGIRAHYQGIDLPEEETSLFLDHQFMPGGLYITPLPGKLFNVNLVVSLDKVSKDNLNLRELFESVVQTHPVLHQKFSAAKRVGNFEGSMLFLGVRKRIISGKRFLVAGDSAGLIEFFSGNGIPQAIHSGKLAALQAIEAIAQNDFSEAKLQPFETNLDRKIKQNYTVGRLMYTLLHNGLFIKMVLGFLNYLSGRPQTNSRLRDLLYSKEPSKLMRSPAFLYNLLIKKTKH